MTAHSKITAKGQVTIPKEVRDALGLREGDRLAFEVEGGRMIVRPEGKKTVAEFLAAIDAIDAPRYPQTELSAEEAIGKWLGEEDERIKSYGVAKRKK